MTTIYERIKARRIELGYSQEDLAKKLGYTSRSTVNKIESGKIDISQSKIALFARALQCTPAYLMGWNEPVNANSEARQNRNPTAVKLHRLAKNIDSGEINLSPNEETMLVSILDHLVHPKEDMPDDDLD